MDESAWARKGACWLAFAFVWLVGPVERDFATACAQEGAQDCVAFEKGEADHELVFRAMNSCDRSLECTLHYRLSCENIRGQVTSSTALRLGFQLASKGERNLTLSAASCKQGWRIHEVDWQCF